MLLTNHDSLPVDLPDEVIEAQENGELVIFAGAGVSMGSPSNLPNFYGLACKICDEYGIPFDESYKDKIDIFLGLLEDKYKFVHEKAQKIINDMNPKFNSLHNYIVSLFHNNKNLRIITTNYDDLLTKAAKTYYDKDIEEYFAPALPIGNDFSGIVYLHGNIDKNPERMVLTDCDFGKAYLTEGWARRFLQQVFQEFSVLFIGYSHEDMLMKYFSRGLVVKVRKRYALTWNERSANWSNLRIQSVDYPHGEFNKKHYYLYEALKYWSEMTRMDFFSTQRRIGEIVSIGPLADARSISTLEYLLTKNVHLRYFIQNASTLEWYKWARDKSYMDCIFKSESNEDEERISLFSDWFVKNLIVEFANFGFDTFIYYEHNMNPILYYDIHRFLNYTTNALDPMLIGKWINILRYISLKSNSQYFGMSQLLLKIRPDQDLSTCFILFDFLTTFVLQPQREYGLIKDNYSIRWKPILLGDSHTFNSFINKVENNPTLFCEKLCAIMTNNLILLYESLFSIGQTWDSISFHRSSIAGHEQDRYSEEFDPIIDLLRFCILSLLNTSPKLANYYIEIWSNSNVTLLRRFSIYAQADNIRKKPLLRLKWLIAKSLLFEYGLKKEIFYLIKKCFGRLNKVEQNSIASQFIEIFNQKKDKDEDLYELYNLFIWITRITSDCEIVKEKLDEIKSNYPEWIPREYPDLDFHMSTSVAEYKSPVSVEELLSKPPTDWLEFVINYKGGDTFEEPDRFGLLEYLAAACSRNPKWGITFLSLFAKVGFNDKDTISAFYQGLKDALIDEKLWGMLFDIIIENPGFAEPHYYLAWLMNEGMEDDNKKIPYNLLNKAEKVSDIIWDTEDNDDWSDLSISGALNHFGGKTALFWLYVLSDRRQVEKLSEIPKSYKDRFENIIHGESKKEIYGLMYLGSQLPFLLSIDRKWASEKILPIFDFSRNSNIAIYVWEGYLILCRFHPNFVQSILYLYQNAINNINCYRELWRKMLEHIAAIMLYCDQSNHEDNTIIELIKKLDKDEDKAIIIRNLEHGINRLDNKSKENLWQRWIKDYWLKRNINVPNYLGSKEKSAFIAFSLEFNLAFNEIPMLIKGYSELEIDNRFFYSLRKKKDIVDVHPNSLAQFLTLILKNSNVNIQPYYCRELNEIVLDLKKNKCRHEELRKLCVEIKKKGCDLEKGLEDYFN